MYSVENSAPVQQGPDVGQGVDGGDVRGAQCVGEGGEGAGGGGGRVGEHGCHLVVALVQQGVRGG